MLALAQLQQRADAEHRPELLEEVHLMGFRQWKDRFGRSVTKGEHAIWILAPMTRRVEEINAQGEREQRPVVVGFRAVPVFNVTQTTGPALPQLPGQVGTADVDADTIDMLRGRVGAAGYDYREELIPNNDPGRGTGVLGYTNPATKQIVVDSRLNPHMKASVIAHELGHVHAGHVDADYSEYQQHRGQMETEAEAAAYITCRRLGIDKESSAAFSPAYIHAWMAQKGADFGRALTTAVKAADAILGADDDHSQHPESS